jgi:hypothetical protein
VIGGQAAAPPVGVRVDHSSVEGRDCSCERGIAEVISEIDAFDDADERAFVCKDGGMPVGVTEERT